MALTETQSLRSVTVSTAAATEPVSVPEAKAFLRVDHSDDDALIGALIKAARGSIERQTGRAMVSQTVTEKMPYATAMAGVEFGRTPATSVTSVSFYDTDGTLQTVAAADYTARTDSEPGTLRLDEAQTDPDTSRGDCVVVVYEVGSATSASVPESLNTAVKMLVAHLYEHRSGDDRLKPGDVKVPPTIGYLLEPYTINDL